MKGILRFFDKVEDKVRGLLSKRPIVYTFIGAVAIVLFWRGVWMIADEILWLNGWWSVLISVVVLLLTGLFVSFFIGDQIILSGIRQEKKLSERTETEVESEELMLHQVKSELKTIESKLEHIEHIEKKLEKDIHK